LHKVDVSSLIDKKLWLDEDWNTLGLSLDEVNAVNSIDDIVLLLKVAIFTIVLQKLWLDKNWNSLGFQLNSSLIFRCSWGSLSSWCWGWSDSTLKNLESHISRWSNHSSDGIDRLSSSNNIMIGSDSSNLA